MTRRVSLFEFMPYGAPELLQGSRPHMARALTLGSALWCALFATTFAILAVIPKPIPVAYIPPLHPTVEIIDTPSWEVVPPPPLQRTDVKPAKADEGVAVPVPDTRRVPDLPDSPPSSSGRESSTGTDTGSPPVSVVAPPGDGAAPTREYQDWEADAKPNEVKVVKPEYPELAKAAGIEGMVYVRVAVGPDGHVLRAEVQKGVPVLNEAALEAARRWVFTPGLAGGHPVTVLVTIPFRFTLHTR